jgi:hypothetical protein
MSTLVEQLPASEGLFKGRTYATENVVSQLLKYIHAYTHIHTHTHT